MKDQTPFGGVYNSWTCWLAQVEEGGEGDLATGIWRGLLPFSLQGCLDRKSGEHEINTATEMRPRGPCDQKRATWRRASLFLSEEAFRRRDASSTAGKIDLVKLHGVYLEISTENGWIGADKRDEASAAQTCVVFVARSGWVTK